MKINREEFLGQLETLAPGLTTQETVDQSSCFCFKDGRILSFNDQIYCERESPINVTGAVRAKPLMDILRKLTVEEVTIKQGEGTLVIIGDHEKARIRMEAEVLLPLDALEKPKTWKKLPEGFAEAIAITQGCAEKSDSGLISNCIHIHPKYVESSDNYQAVRYRIKTGVEESILVRRDSIKHIKDLDMTEFAETSSWLHFRNPSGLIFSCRRSVDQFPSMDFVFKFENGQPVTLPAGLGEALDKAQVFSQENAEKEDQNVQIKLASGRVFIKGQGASGEYIGRKRIAYEGPPMTFLIDPKLLQEISTKHNDCQINETQLLVVGERFKYVSSLANPKNEKEGTEEAEDE